MHTHYSRTSDSHFGHYLTMMSRRRTMIVTTTVITILGPSFSLTAALPSLHQRYKVSHLQGRFEAVTAFLHEHPDAAHRRVRTCVFVTSEWWR
jgi:hypothetical protein